MCTGFARWNVIVIDERNHLSCFGVASFVFLCQAVSVDFHSHRHRRRRDIGGARGLQFPASGTTSALVARRWGKNRDGPSRTAQEHTLVVAGPRTFPSLRMWRFAHALSIWKCAGARGGRKHHGGERKRKVSSVLAH